MVNWIGDSLNDNNPALRSEGFSLEAGTRFAILGAGRVAISLAFLLKTAGHRIIGCSARSSESLERAARYLECPCSTDYVESVEGADAILIAVPDDTVADVAESLASLESLDAIVALHTAGSLGIESLLSLHEAGLGTTAIHPLQSIPDIDTGIERIPGSWFGVTCDTPMRDWSENFVSAVGGSVHWVTEEERPLYHAAAVFASNYLVVLAAVVEDLRGDLSPYMPLIEATVSSLGTLGTAKALTGPVVRGDVGTIERHLRALEQKSELSEVYRALAGAALESAERFGRIDNEDAERVRKVLKDQQ
jgi:predicted short-subunit dehydrogenase-like oxidoreductase (DUF2520 family)